MSSVRSYFESVQSEFPNPKLEEYRYSKFVLNLDKLIIQKNSGKTISLPWESDYTFFADQKQQLTSKQYTELPAVFHRHQNYFKQAGILHNSEVYEISCNQEEVTVSFVATKNTILTDKIYLHIQAEKTVKVNVKFYTEEQSLAIPVIFVDAQKETHVELIYTVDEQYNKGMIAPTFELTAEDNSHVSLQTMTKGIENHRLAFIGYCLGKESHIDLRTGFYLQKQETCDLFVRIFHEAPDSTSNQMIKSVASDSSVMNFNGQIYANDKAHNIYAYQMLKGMLLGQDAEINARPQLDIEYYELACSHGVSIGGFDPEELFYLKSRGIKQQDVYPILFYGFFCEPFIDIDNNTYWSERIKNLLQIEKI